MRSALRPDRPATVVVRGRAGASGALRGCVALLALAAAGCLDDSATAPQTTPARLAVNASVTGAAVAQVTALGVRVDYLRNTGGNALLTNEQLSLSDVAPGSTISRPLTVELAPCLADPAHLPEPGSCRVMIQVTLLAGAQVLDVTSIGPVDLRPGQTAEPQAVTLHAVSALAITPGAPATLYPDDELQLTATATDASGQPVNGRDIAWTSSAQAVATVASNGTVTAVAPGTTTINASTGGRQASVNVIVLARPTIVASATELSFSARRTAMLPDPRSIQIANGGAGALTGLAVGAITYQGGATGWLTTSLSSTTAPATLHIRPSSTDLAPGTYTAVVPITAPGATSSAAIKVSYEMLPGVVLSVDPGSVMLSPEVTQEVTVTASGPVSQLNATVEYSSFQTGWVDATMDGSTLYLTLNDGAASLLPGPQTARVVVSAPEAPNPAEVLVTFDSDGSQYYVSMSTYCTIQPQGFRFDPALRSWSDTTSYPGFGVTLTIQGVGLSFSGGGTTAHISTGGSVVALRDPLYSGYMQATITAALDVAPETMRDSTYVEDQLLFYCSNGYVDQRVGPQGDDGRPVPSLLRSRGVALPPTQAVGPSRASRVAGGID